MLPSVDELLKTISVETLDEINQAFQQWSLEESMSSKKGFDKDVLTLYVLVLLWLHALEHHRSNAFILQASQLINY